MSIPIKKHISYKIPLQQSYLTLDFFGKKKSLPSSYLIQKQPSQLEYDYLQKIYPRQHIVFLQQIHGNKTVNITFNHIENSNNSIFLCEADSSYTNEYNIPIIIRVADCIPILFWTTFEKNTYIGGIHAGWRGLKNNIVTKTFYEIKKIHPALIQNLYFWIGPHIQRDSYKVSSNFTQNFKEQDIQKSLYEKEYNFYFDLKSIAIKQIQNANINIKERWYKKEDSLIDTYTNKHYYSYRKYKSLYRNIALLKFKTNY